MIWHISPITVLHCKCLLWVQFSLLRVSLFSVLQQFFFFWGGIGGGGSQSCSVNYAVLWVTESKQEYRANAVTKQEVVIEISGG